MTSGSGLTRGTCWIILIPICRMALDVPSQPPEPQHANSLREQKGQELDCLPARAHSDNRARGREYGEVAAKSLVEAPPWYGPAVPKRPDGLKQRVGDIVGDAPAGALKQEHLD